MKKNIFTVALLAMAVATSCNKELDSEMSVTEGDSPKGEPVTVTIDVNCGSTRSVTTLSGENNINSVQIVVFDEKGDYKGSAYTSIGASPMVEVSAGTLTFAVIVNSAYIEPSEVKTLTDLHERITGLKDNSEGNFIMYGEKIEQISGSKRVTVDVKRIIARVVISKITNAIDPEALPYDFILKRIYLINVVGDAKMVSSGTYTPAVWYNYAGENSDLKNFLCSENIDRTIQPGDVYNIPHYFYCYPNPTEYDDGVTHIEIGKYTRLDVEAEINGRTYYYIISIKGISSNCTYEVTNLTVTGTGSVLPDAAAYIAQSFADVRVIDWDDGGEYTARIPNL